MLWLLIRVAVFILIVGALAFGAATLMDTPGSVTVSWNGMEYPPISPLMFAGYVIVACIALLILFKLVGLLIAVIRFISGDETAISRFFTRSRQRRGMEALATGMVALREGDEETALKKAAKASRLLDRPDLVNMLGADAAVAAGDADKAEKYLRALALEDRTKLIGVNGLLEKATGEGDDERALKMARRAASSPRDAGVLDRLIALQADAGDWAGARASMEAKVRAGHLPRDVGRRRDAVLALADARQAAAAGDVDRAKAAAIAANETAPGLAPGAVAAAEHFITDGKTKQAERALRRAWKEAPHPDLARAFAAVAPDETPDARQKRFGRLIAENKDHIESKLLAAELALAAEDFPGARRELGDLAETNPSTRTLAIMAAVEKGSGAGEAVVQGWLARALSAPRGERWTCSNCGHVHGDWSPLCENCDAVDTLEWAAPQGELETAENEAALLPLIVGALTGPQEDDTAQDAAGDATETAEAAPKDAPAEPASDETPKETAAADSDNAEKDGASTGETPQKTAA